VWIFEARMINREGLSITFGSNFRYPGEKTMRQHHSNKTDFGSSVCLWASRELKIHTLFMETYP
jgi:hypothetical protein